MTRSLRLGLPGVIAGLLLVLAAAPALADSTPRWDVALEVRPDGDLIVTETIQQTFDSRRRGIFRYIPVAERLAPDGLVTVPDGDTDDWFQRIRIDDISVASATAPTELEIDRPSRHDSNGEVSIRIGEEDTFITGTHEYVIRYRVEGALLAMDADTTILRWDVVGDDWQQPIQELTVVVTGPGIRPGDALCAVDAGLDTTAVCRPDASAETFRAATTGELLYSAVSVSVPFDASMIAAPEPILQREPNLAAAFVGDGRVWPISILLTLLLGLGTGRLLYREGRDRELRGDVTVDGRIDSTHDRITNERTRRLFAARADPVEFRPPDDLRPGQLGLVIDERVDPVDVSATIVDLAVRGHLTIEETSSTTLWWTNSDWTLHQRPPPPGDVINPWEQHLLDGLFDDRQEVAVSELKGEFHTSYVEARTALYEDGQERGWFPARPDKVRTRWAVTGAFVMVAGMVGVGFAAYFSRMALAVVPILVTGLVVLVAHGRMPRRTPSGSALMTRTLGFRHFIVTAEANRAQFAEQEHLFTEYLPYAVVFGATEQWARTFAGLGVLTSAGGVGAWYIGTGVFDATSFSSGMSSFSSTIGTAASTAPSSSGGGGGFSGGGGFGGGGGGSW